MLSERKGSKMAQDKRNNGQPSQGALEALNGAVDWGNSDGFSIWENAQDAGENGLDNWEGRQETHDMFKDSYQ